jgi:hypothetical protein
MVYAFFFLATIAPQGDTEAILKSDFGKIQFVSDAPLEVIKASSDALKGVIDTSKQSFAFSVAVNTFKGFNSPLQQQHFNENYMESVKFPVATFTGKIIETVNFSKTGTYDIRAKGVLFIHGIKSERIIRGTVEVIPGKIRIVSQFTVHLEDHNIKIPRIVYQKIAPEVTIGTEVVFPYSKP